MRGRRGRGRMKKGEEEEEEEEEGIVTYLRFMSPQIPQLIQNIHIPKRTQDPTHQPRFPHRLLHTLKPAPHHLFRTHHPCHTTRHFAQQIVRPRHGLFPRRHRMRNLFRGFQSRIYHGHRDHHDTMLDTSRQGGDFGEQALVGWTGHDLMGVSLGAGVWTDDDDGGAEVFDEMPAGAGDGEDVGVGGDGAEDLEGGVVLEEEVVFDAEAADVFEHVAELHVFGVGAETVESISHCVIVSEMRSLSLQSPLWGGRVKDAGKEMIMWDNSILKG